MRRFQRPNAPPVASAHQRRHLPAPQCRHPASHPARPPPRRTAEAPCSGLPQDHIVEKAKWEEREASLLPLPPPSSRGGPFRRPATHQHTRSQLRRHHSGRRLFHSHAMHQLDIRQLVTRPRQPPAAASSAAKTATGLATAHCITAPSAAKAATGPTNALASRPRQPSAPGNFRCWRTSSSARPHGSAVRSQGRMEPGPWAG